MKQDIVQSVDRAFSLIEAIAEDQHNLMDIAKYVGLSKSTVHRLLQTLMYKGYVTQSEDSLYHLSTKFLYLSQQVVKDIDIIEIAKPHLKALNELTEEVVHLVMIEADSAVYIDKIEAKSNIRMYSYVGKRIPLTTSAVGKAYLAFTNRVSRDEFIEGLDEIKPLTEHTLTKAGLIQGLERTQQRGFAIDAEENEMGVICVAAPIYNHMGKIKYAVSISTPTFRMDEEKIASYGDAVKEATLKISKQIGYTER